MKGPVVTIQVGAEGEEFVLHKDLLTSKCPEFFGAAFKGEFSEAQSSIIKLPEDDALAFRLFIDWLYCGYIPPIPFNRDWVGQSVQTMEASGQLDAEGPYHQLYYMAEKWLIHSLANQVIDFIRNFHNGTQTTVYPEFVVMGYHNTHDKSPLREYLMRSVAFVTSQYSNRDKSTLDEDYFSAFRTGSSVAESDVLRDVLKHFVHMRCIKATDNPHMGDPGKYHVVPQEKKKGLQQR